MRDWKIQIVPAFMQLSPIRIAQRIVDELVVRQMVQAILERRRIDRKTAEPVRYGFVQDLVLEQGEVRSLVNHTAKLMLRRADGRDAQHRHWNIPPPRETGGSNRAVAPDGH